MAYYKNKKMTHSPNRFSIVEDNKELMYRFAKRDRKRKIGYDRDTKFQYMEVSETYPVEPTADEVYNAWEAHIKFLENQKF